MNLILSTILMLIQIQNSGLLTFLILMTDILFSLKSLLKSMKLLQKLAPALNVEVTDLLMDFSSPDKPGRVQLESMLDNGELEIWYRSKKLSEKELRRVYRVIEAALDDWDEKDASGE